MNFKSWKEVSSGSIKALFFDLLSELLPHYQ